MRETQAGCQLKRPKMGLRSWLCGGSQSRSCGEEYQDERTILDPESSHIPKSDTDVAPVTELTSGTLGLDDYAVEVPTEVSLDPQTDPWYSLPNLGRFVLQRRQRLRQGFFRTGRIFNKERKSTGAKRKGETSVPSHEDQQVDVNEPSVRPPEELVVIDGGVNASAMLAAPSDSALAPPKLGKDATELETTIGGENAKLETVFLSEGISIPRTETAPGMESPSTRLDSVGGDVDGNSHVLTETEPERRSSSKPMSDIQSLDATSESESKRSSMHNPMAPSRQDSDDWCTSAGMVKNAGGEQKSEKFFYDTGSPDAWASELFAEKHKLPLRPFLPEQLKVYETIGNELVIPQHYIEVWLMDEHHGMVQFKKEQLNIAKSKSMGGRGLLLGRAFMKDNDIKLDPKQGPGVYVFTAREASKGKCTIHSLEYFELIDNKQRIKKLRDVCWIKKRRIVFEHWLSQRQPLGQRRLRQAAPKPQSKRHHLEPVPHPRFSKPSHLPSTLDCDGGRWNKVVKSEFRYQSRWSKLNLASVDYIPKMNKLARISIGGVAYSPLHYCLSFVAIRTDFMRNDRSRRMRDWRKMMDDKGLRGANALRRGPDQIAILYLHVCDKTATTFRSAYKITAPFAYLPIIASNFQAVCIPGLIFFRPSVYLNHVAHENGDLLNWSEVQTNSGHRVHLPMMRELACPSYKV